MTSSQNLKRGFDYIRKNFNSSQVDFVKPRIKDYEIARAINIKDNRMLSTHIYSTIKKPAVSRAGFCSFTCC